MSAYGGLQASAIMGQPLYGTDATTPIIAGGDGTTRSPPHRRRGGNGHGVSVKLMVATSVILLVIATAVLVAGVMMKNDANGLNCSSGCKRFMLAIYIIVGTLGGFAHLGFAATWKPLRCFAYPFAVCVFIIALALAVCGVAAVVVATGHVDIDGIDDIWQDAVRNRDGAVCALQAQFDCSGFTSCCSGVEFNATTGAVISVTPSICNATLPVITSQCDPTCTSNLANLTPCRGAMVKSLRRHLGVVAGILFAGFAIFAVGCVAALRSTVHHRRYHV